MRIYFCKFSFRFERFSVLIEMFLFSRPLIKLTDRLLLVGVILDADVEKLLYMIDPETWDPSYEKGNFIQIMIKVYLIILLLNFRGQR